MDAIRYFDSGPVSERWTDSTRTHTTYTEAGAVVAVVPYTTGETAAAVVSAARAASDGNDATLRTRANAALNANVTYLALSPPTTAQAIAQVALLTRECNALIRLALSSLSDISGT